MHRRAWILGALGVPAAARVPGAAQAPTPADRLRIPGAVQQRAEVTEAQNDETVKAIERRLKCTCGCNLDIFTCRTTDFTCTTSPALHREVVALLAEGRTPDEVVADFVARYGEEVLMAPQPEGFNLAGYLVPGLVVLLAGSILAWVLVRRQSAAAPVPAPVAASVAGLAVPPVAGASADELDRLAAALRELDQ